MATTAAKRTAPSSTIAHKVYVRSTKSGNATKIVREQYLRTDIPCSSKACSICNEQVITNANGTINTALLSESPSKNLKRGPHYVIVDTNIALKAIDLLEHKAAFYDVIIPQIVLEEARNKSLPIYNRLRNLSKSSIDDKRVYVFHNEFRKETHTPRLPNESINDKNDRAIRKVCSWYTEHLKKTKNAPEVVLLSEDRANREKAIEEGLNCVSLKDYLKEFKNSDELLDLAPNEETALKVEETSYTPYYPMSRLLGGVKNSTLHRGNLSINQYNILEGTVSSPAYNKPILIIGKKNLNRAFHGDSVVIELLPQTQWKHPSSQIVEEGNLGSENADNDTETVVSDEELKVLAAEAKQTQENTELKVQPTARIVGIMKRSWRFYVGHISSKTVITDDTNAQRNVLVHPADKCIPRIRIRTRKAKELLGKRIVIAVDDWPETSRHPEGHFIRSLGEIESKQAETEALLLEHDVEYRPFPKSVLNCLPAEGHNWKVPQLLDGDEQIKKRRDLRDLLVCSIDPPGCQDIDDALHAYELPNGNYHVGVHIADVTHFVKPNTALDDEGASRGTSVYLVDKRIDMLPMLLGTDLCSLKPYVDRYAFSVIWELTPNAEIVNVDYTKSIIRSREAFAYEQAQSRIDDDSQQDDLTKGMRILLKLSKKLKQARIDAGALNLASPEVKVHVDSETSDPGDVEVKKLLETNSLVEEFMLLANISVAKKIYDAYPQTAMLRRHGAPPATNFDILNEQLRIKKSMHIDTESSKTMADSLDECVDPSEPFFNTLVRIMATRCMMAAEYFSSGSYGYPEFRHYGLASEIYTHFTSPIRRYADVVAHRQLAGAIQYETLDQSHREKGKMEKVCNNINKRHRNAQFAGRASIEYYVGQVLKDVDTVQEGFVIKVFSNGVVVLVPKYGVEGLIHLADLGDPDTAEFDEENFTLKVGGREVSIFDKVKVGVESVKDETTGKRKVKMTLK